MEHQNDELEIDLMEIFYVLKSRILLLILSAVVFAISSGLFTYYLVTPLYSSTAGIYVLTKDSVISYADLQIGSSLTNDYIQIIQSRTVLENVLENLSLDEEMTFKQLSNCINISNPSDTRILNLSVTYDDPRMAKEIVDELAEVAIVRISEIMDTQIPNVFEWGYVDTRPVSPHMKKNIAIAGFFGLLLAAIIVVVLHIMDDTIHSSEDIEKYLGLNMLAAIPISEGSQDTLRQDDRKRRHGDRDRKSGG